MSIHLQLLVVKEEADLQSEAITTFDRVELDQDSRVFKQIANLDSRRGSRPKLTTFPTIRTHPIPEQSWIVESYEGKESKTREDVYGYELRFSYAQDLRKLALPEDSTQGMREVKALIDSLPDQTPIIFMWL